MVKEGPPPPSLNPGDAPVYLYIYQYLQDKKIYSYIWRNVLYSESIHSLFINFQKRLHICMYSASKRCF